MHKKFTVIVPIEYIQSNQLKVFDDWFGVVCVAPDGSFIDSMTMRETIPDFLCLAIVSWSDEHAHRLGAAQDYVKATKPPFLPEITYLYGEIHWDGLAFVASQGLAWLAHEQARLIATLGRDLGVLRRQNEEMQNNFAALEHFVMNADVPQYREVFLNDPQIDLDAGQIFSGSQTAVVTQLLPVSSKNFCGLSLHVAARNPRLKDELQLRLTTPEDGREVARWTVPVSHLAIGWNAFGLARTLGSLDRSLVLELIGGGRFQGQLRLSLGRMLPLPPYRLIDAASGRPVVDRALALRVLTAVPGLAVAHPRTTLLADGDRSQREIEQFFSPCIHPVARDVLAGVVMVSLPGTSENTDFVRFETEDGSVFCHPGYDQASVGLVAAACPPGTDGVACDLRIANPKANPIEFRLGIVRSFDGTGLDGVLDREADAGTIVALSEWTTMAANQSTRLQVLLETPLEETASLVFATRMANAMSNDFAWAKFTNVRLAATASA